MNTAGRIIFLRNKLGLSQKSFANLLQRSAGYINKVENGHFRVTHELMAAICATFFVPYSWLETGEGSLNVISVGERFRQVRRARGYTQEELARELSVSRNAIGMIERGIIRPSDDLVDCLANKFWINKRWLLTGTGSMEKVELTPFYELLRRDPDVRAHIRSFIDHLEHPSRVAEE